jgi:RNA-directed DNA polymerase
MDSRLRRLRPTFRAISTNSGIVLRELLSSAGAAGRYSESRGGTRPLGIPTVADRIAQEVVRRYLEPILEPVFHPDSYGYRPGKSAIDAVRQARQRCWRYDWVLDLDVKGYFDSIDWELLLLAVRRHTDCPWVLLYIERWLKVPVQMEDGSVMPRTAGTPQGGVVAPRTQKITFGPGRSGVCMVG